MNTNFFDQFTPEQMRAQYAKNARQLRDLQAQAEREAAELFKVALNCPVPGYVENSVMHCHAKALIGREQDQTIQPWWFGEPKFKATCLWLRGGLLPLVPTNKLTPPAKGTEEHKQWSAVHRASPGKNRWKERSRTFPLVGKAMAEQWG